jgi:hypothetical protein
MGITSQAWVTPSLKAVVLPAHAQTSMECESGVSLVLEVTSPDFSLLEMELFSTGGGSVSLFEINPGDLSGDGSRIVYDQCHTADACYELVIRGGEGTAVLTQGALSENQMFPPTPTNIILGTICQ